MIDLIRGIRCSLYNGKITDLLMDIAQKDCSFYIESCMEIENKHQLVPKLLRNVHANGQDIQRLAAISIWELVLHMYPKGKQAEKINTYEDFLKSECACCIIFYDCGLLDIYIKDQVELNRIWEKLTSLQAQDMIVITNTTDSRTVLHL